MPRLPVGNPRHNRYLNAALEPSPLSKTRIRRQQRYRSSIYRCRVVRYNVPWFIVESYLQCCQVSSTLTLVLICGYIIGGIRFLTIRLRRQTHPRHQPNDQRQREQNAQQLSSYFLFYVKILLIFLPCAKQAFRL